MKRMRIPLIIVMGLAVLGVILGSFLDLKISQAIASPTNGFGLTVSVIVPTIGLASLSFVGGGFFAIGFQNSRQKPLRIVSFILFALALGASVYFAGQEDFGPNGFTDAAPRIVGYIIAFFPLAGASFLGYWMFRHNEEKKLWILFLVYIAVIFIVLVPFITGAKAIMHRPRYRLLASDDTLAFKNWWQPTFDYKDYIAAHPGVTSEEFKSFPSGHSAYMAMLIPFVTFMPLWDKKMGQYQLPEFFITLALCLLAMFARILSAAHFLSDVSMGLFGMSLFTLIANEIVMRMKIFHPEEKTE